LTARLIQTRKGFHTLKRLQIAIGLLISVGALYLALRGVHWREVGTAAREANYLLIAAAAVLLCFTLLLRALRWRLLFHPLKDLNVWYLFGSLNVAYLINNILPFNLGDLGRAYLLSEVEGISATRTLSTIVVERVLDVITLLLFLLILVPFVDIPSRARWSAAILAAVVSTVAITLIILSRRRGVAMRLLDFGLRFAPERFHAKLTEMTQSALDGFAVLSDGRVAVQLGAWSAVTWLCVSLVVFMGTEAFSLDVGFAAAMFLVIVTTFGFFVPSSPGSFGVYHAIVISTLTNVFDVGKNDAVSYALIIHLVFYLPPMFLGLAFLWKERQLWQRTSFLDKLGSFRREQGASATG
jgi:uncharacterized protein (TIRG00374 family)